MAQAARPQTAEATAQHRRFSLNTDGQPHPLENTLVAVTVVLGLVSIITAGFNSLHLVSSWTGLAGLLTGAYGQYRSVTTAERFAVIIGMGLAGIGFYLGMAHGGLFGGVVG
jgi:hypothetical protein